MTKITLESVGNEYDITIDGHAGYNPGNDIVCASCSILTYTLAEMAKEIEDADEITVDACELGDGYFHLKVREHIKGITRWNHTIDAIMTGFELLENKYPDHVCVNSVVRTL